MYNRNAYIGRNVEILFKNSIGDNPSAITAIQRHFNIAKSFTSMEQLWLAFVMKEKYNKVWDGEEWINEKP